MFWEVMTLVELMYLVFFLLLLGGPIGGLCKLIEWAKGREARHQTEIRQRREARRQQPKVKEIVKVA